MRSASVKCPFCAKEKDKVIDSRLSKDGEAIRRRRQCLSCRRRFTTYEYIESSLMVVKKDGRREAFGREKVLRGIRRACEKRPVATEAIERLVEQIEREIQDLGQKEVASSVIGEKVMAGLRGLDGVAYVRFASVYRSFRDTAQFMDELKKLLE
jgi:transcriptional repressor NrdR